ncbi:hypothetical protein, conserved [Eimeria brunetti]|uniref:carnosine N-methyltransferase n=1 Tax=Eimeria brunetti TaxID=51314 RepID=U6LHQ2_9EIME|nr:hypothetical protein, conserved [Eimeria brunetti]
MLPWEVAEELEHLASVRRAFALYEADSLAELARIAKALRGLSSEDQRLIGPPFLEDRIKAIKEAVAVNQQFIDFMLLAAASVGPCSPREEGGGYNEAAAEAQQQQQQQGQGQGQGQEGQGQEGQGQQQQGQGQQQQQQQQGQQKQMQFKQGKGGQQLAKKRRRKKMQQQQKMMQQQLQQEHQEQHKNQQEQQQEQQHLLLQQQQLGSNDNLENRRLLLEADQEDPEKLTRNLSKVRSTLRQFVRDWAEEGAEEREAAYGPLLRALEEHLPIIPGKDPPRVLCPGSGLGRLPFEVMRRGYACQGNEFSYFMLIGPSNPKP